MPLRPGYLPWLERVSKNLHGFLILTRCFTKGPYNWGSVQTREESGLAWDKIWFVALILYLVQ